MEKEELLTGSIIAKSSIRIIYHGGSQPGSVRTITPLNITNNKVRARDHSTGKVKSFFIDKIQIHIGDKPPVAEAWNADNEPKYFSIDHVYQKWSPYFYDKEFALVKNNDSISVNKKSKNGKITKDQIVSLFYKEYTNEHIYNLQEDCFDKIVIKRKMPWIVRFKNKPSKSFKHIDSAVKVLIAEAIEKSG